MKRTLFALAFVALFVTGIVVRADEPTTKPAEHKEHKKFMINEPYKGLTDLTDDQKQQITDLHKKALEDKNAIDAKEKADILAVLTDDQKKELDAVEAKRKADEEKRHAEHEAAKLNKGAATTKPSDDAK